MLLKKKHMIPRCTISNKKHSDENSFPLERIKPHIWSDTLSFSNMLPNVSPSKICRDVKISHHQLHLVLLSMK